MQRRLVLAKQLFCAAVLLAPLILLGCASVPRAGAEKRAQAEAALQPKTRFGVFAPGPAGCAEAASTDSLRQCLEFQRFLFEDCVGRLSYAQQRWMIPQLGRFASEDPVGVTAGRMLAVRELSGFGYVGGNPLRW
ncbi:MAG TPA: hypothetical protein VMR96_01660, partial [Solirubrobacterales bacterium]|nr:hypothetical protein [Solirubrobacterales bacterium]